MNAHFWCRKNEWIWRFLKNNNRVHCSACTITPLLSKYFYKELRSAAISLIPRVLLGYHVNCSKQKQTCSLNSVLTRQLLSSFTLARPHLQILCMENKFSVSNFWHWPTRMRGSQTHLQLPCMWKITSVLKNTTVKLQYF